MCAGKTVTLLLSLLLFSAAANAKVCVRLDHENSALATVSGRVTTHHKAPGELRAADGPFLMLDQPLLADLAGGECSKWRKIAILADTQFEIRRWANQHVIIEGKLGRFGSALVSPAIFIEITTIKKD